MLQVEMKTYASDALEDAMRLAQVKAMNSYTFSDCFNYLNYTWSDIYNSLLMKDSGYYSKTVQLKQRLTRLPPYVANSILVYRATRPTEKRLVYKRSGNNDQLGSCTYRISGTDLFCPDAEITTVWLEYAPQPPQLFFPMYNRDPKIWREHDVVVKKDWGIFYLTTEELGDEWTVEDLRTQQLTLKLRNRADLSGDSDIDIQDKITNLPPSDLWKLIYITCDYPYIFLSFEHSITGEHLSGFYTREFEWVEYNPFAYMGRNSNVEYIQCKWNDKTGMGVIIRDWNDVADSVPKIKELGWTPDTLLIYPSPIVYRYLVARLAEKFASMNESNVMGVQQELKDARFAFEAFIEKDKSAFRRINVVTGPTIEDYL